MGPGLWFYGRQIEVFPHQSEYPASKHVSSHRLVAQSRDGVDSGIAGAGYTHNSVPWYL